MKVSVTINRQQYSFDSRRPLDISIPLLFNGPQPNHFDAPPAGSAPLSAGGFVGDTNSGGGCNVATLQLTPHCNGTHTESAGHILNQPLPLPPVLDEALIAATLITVTPQPAGDIEDSYRPQPQRDDVLITRRQLAKALAEANRDFLDGLIIRTLPNADDKKQRRYLQHPPPFLSFEAMDFLDEINIRHLLVDMPSIDRMFDDGLLNNHHKFWKIPEKSHQANNASRLDRTISELIFVDNDIPDGAYFVNIQVPPFMSDAAPSRVFVFELVKSEK